MALSVLKSDKDPHDVAFFHHQKLFVVERTSVPEPLAETILCHDFYKPFRFNSPCPCVPFATSNDFALAAFLCESGMIQPTLGFSSLRCDAPTRGVYRF